MQAIRAVVLSLVIGLSGCTGFSMGPLGVAVAPVQPVHVGSPQVPTIHAHYRTWGVWAFRSW